MRTIVGLTCRYLFIPKIIFMYNISHRNERKHRKKAFTYTVLIALSIAGVIFFHDQLADLPELIMNLISPAAAETSTPVAGV